MRCSASRRLGVVVKPEHTGVHKNRAPGHHHPLERDKPTHRPKEETCVAGQFANNYGSCQPSVFLPGDGRSTGAASVAEMDTGNTRARESRAEKGDSYHLKNSREFQTSRRAPHKIWRPGPRPGRAERRLTKVARTDPSLHPGHGSFLCQRQRNPRNPWENPSFIDVGSSPKDPAGDAAGNGRKLRCGAL
ncbi:MAG: hypothetical protein KatS3mg114_0748 [Planctomycetaceae bacterium]|nr:MAG: hypothetical protein KatS3mg114_0748 [Planctomycetaceae bacterium]